MISFLTRGWIIACDCPVHKAIFVLDHAAVVPLAGIITFRQLVAYPGIFQLDRTLLRIASYGQHRIVPAEPEGVADGQADLLLDAPHSGSRPSHTVDLVSDNGSWAAGRRRELPVRRR